MKRWGLQTDVDDAKIALSLARLIRGATGQGFGKMHLFGFSYGTWVAYPVVNQETQLPQFLRNVKGLIPVDAGVTFAAGEPFRDLLCDLLPQDQARYAAGTYNDDFSFLKQVGDLARSAPDDASPFADGFTNYQFALFVGASITYPPSWHFVAGVFNDSGITTALQYTDPWLWIDVERAIPLYFPVLGDTDQEKVTCYDVVAPFDDHLAEVTLPILYVGAAGGFGERGYYAVTLTASTDITKSIVQLHPSDQPELDFGHADLFTATNAETLVWQPILNWLVAHR
jgi:pimeloyl-ACP methyl ester carboxylesterase